jgi:hypothetical protein
MGLKDYTTKPENHTDKDEKENQDMITNYELDIKSHFKLPISYLNNKQSLRENIIEDLELVTCMDSSDNSIYDGVFSPKTYAGRYIMKEMPKHYTSDKDYLTDTQGLLKNYKRLDDEASNSEDLENVINIWKEIKGDPSFKTKYHYIEWNYWAHLNRSEFVLQFLSMYSLASPVLSLLVPVIMCIMPFFIIKAKGMDVTWKEYIHVLKVIASNHALCRIFTSFSSVSIDQKAYLILSTAFYAFSIYQNFLSCLRFYRNMQKMHGELLIIRNYIEKTIITMNNVLQHTSSLASYSPFNEGIIANREKLQIFKDKLENIQGDDLNIRNVTQIGKLMKHFYDMHDDQTCGSMFLYSFGFHGFLENMDGIIQHIRKKNIGFSTFETKKKSVLRDAYYGALINRNKVKNDIRLDKTMVLTGPNASGKTTTLKTTLINIILSQQLGCGFYKSATINPYDFIHCYLNIPDTSGRDSLFQAEARRCKEIIDIVQKNNKQRHFCVFDELYSGTNPDEAILSATAFMKYLIKNKRVNSVLTTHFIDVCKSLDKDKHIRNCHMSTSHHNGIFEYKYLLKSGISEVKGGMQVLTDMEYPEEIIKNASK